MTEAKQQMRKWRTTWNVARNDSKHRGIPFELTFEQWLTIWQKSGHFHQRGRRWYQYQMARHGDVGSYAVGNVSIITCRENRALQIVRSISYPGSKNPNSKLTEQQVKQLRLDYDGKYGSFAALARQYGLTSVTVQYIIKRKLWTHI